MWNEGVQPLMENRIDEREAYQRITKPLREFMQANVREKDIALSRASRNDAPPRRRGCTSGAGEAAPATEVDMRVLVPAFMVSELRRGFESGFDHPAVPRHRPDRRDARDVDGHDDVPPTAISLPFKVLFSS